jgi:hypothetical protein
VVVERHCGVDAIDNPPVDGHTGVDDVDRPAHVGDREADDSVRYLSLAR